MKKTISLILMATTIVGAVIAKKGSPSDLQVQSKKVVIDKLGKVKDPLNTQRATTADTTSLSGVDVVTNSNSGIQYATHTSTLEDGTILGFSISSSTAYFCGAISSAKSVTIPETITYNNKTYSVMYIGRYSGSNYTLDFRKATSVASLTIPSVATNIYNSIPSTISELHLLGTTPPNIYYSNINAGTTVYVPKGAYSTYQSY